MDQVDATRLARELHEGPIQELTVARIRLDLVRRHTEGAGLDSEIAAVDTALGKAADQLRALMMNLQSARD